MSSYSPATTNESLSRSQLSYGWTSKFNPSASSGLWGYKKYLTFIHSDLTSSEITVFVHECRHKLFAFLF